MNGNPIIRGILLEGLNFAGKSSTAVALASLLRAHGCDVAVRHCHVSDDPVVRQLQGEAKAAVRATGSGRFPDPELLRGFNTLKSAQTLIDSVLAAATPYAAGAGGPILVQDRHWFSQYCSNEFFNPGEGLLASVWRDHHAPCFTVQAYLTCAPAERRRRAGGRDGDTHGLNSYLRHHLDRLADLDTFSLRIIGEDPRWTVLSTDDHSPAEIAHRLLTVFHARDQQPTAATVPGVGPVVAA
ncbi:methylmalonyl-CoA mutase cobalamin-binding subunit [Streptacidiphilus sp. MAP12-33]|uniref:hypothetical protein n=1 Tax=Streptacidiphilus sp. MAP12-33 TaxID=3156266 RepID=UPI0035190943